MTTVPFATHPSLSIMPGIRHGFFGRAGGVSSGLYDSLNAGLGSQDDPALVHENRRRMAQALGAAPDRLLTVYQIHSTEVVTVTQPWVPTDAPKADALVTNRPGLMVCALAADCTPTLLADAEAGVIGAAHAGWRGAKGGILEKTVVAMQALGAQIDRITAVIGPCIGPHSYEVGTEFEAAFLSDSPENAQFFTPGRAGHAYFDLPGYVLARLQQTGVRQAKWLGKDTLELQRDYFSYRATTLARMPDYGRNLSGIILTD